MIVELTVNISDNWQKYFKTHEPEYALSCASYKYKCHPSESIG
jgi:hypothetical protein